MNVNRYQFDSIVNKTRKQITPICHGEENEYYRELAQIEIKMEKFHKRFHINGRQAMEIIQIVLLDINAAIMNDTWDSSCFEEECYPECIHEIEMLFMPDKNPELAEQLKSPLQMNEQYFELARKVLIRIYESVKQWTKDSGSNGYFNFISGFIRIEILDNRKYIVESTYLND